mgnify:CR=1 FL=1
MTLQWKPITASRYDDRLEVLPPALMAHNGFLMGDPMIHRICRITGTLAPAYLAYLSLRGQCYEALEPYTVDEFRTLTPSEIARAFATPPARSMSVNTPPEDMS